MKLKLRFFAKVRSTFWYLLKKYKIDLRATYFKVRSIIIKFPTLEILIE